MKIENAPIEMLERLYDKLDESDFCEDENGLWIDLDEYWQFKNKIKNEIKKKLEENENVDINYKALINNVIVPHEKYEELIFEQASKTLDSAQKENEVPYDVLRCLNLYINNKIINIEKFKLMLSKNSFCSMIISPESYDFTNFQIDELNNLNSGILKELSENKIAKEKIHVILKKYLEVDMDEHLTQIYIKWFS